MTSWSQQLSRDAREAAAQWPVDLQAKMHRELDSLCGQPTTGRYNEDDDIWVSESQGYPRFRFNYRLDERLQRLRVEHVAYRIVAPPQEVHVFLSYSRKNGVWFRHLRRALQPLRDFDIILWSDQDLLPGQMWDELIKTKVTHTGAALLLVSEAFLASDYIQRDELTPFLARAESPRTLGHDDSPFLLLWIPLAHEKKLKRDEWGRRLLPFQALINPRRPLGKFSEARARRVLNQICRDTHRAIHAQLLRQRS